MIVLQCCFLILKSTTLADRLTPVDKLVLLVAALCHDVGHNGRTNSYHISSRTALAERYNDDSVQENHHASLTFDIL